MRKLIALILALMLACTLLPAAAEVAADSVLGEWFVTEMTQGDMTIDPATMGMEISLMLNEDGTMVMTMAGEGVEGTWEMADGKLLLTAGENPGKASAEVWLDAPTAEAGGTKLGAVAFDTGVLDSAAEKETSGEGTIWSWVSGQMDAPVSGVHALYFVFTSDSAETLCSFDQFVFTK